MWRDLTQRESLLERINDLAQELQVSRSRLFVLAVEEFIQRHENRRLLEALNDAYDDVPDSDEQALHDKMRQQHRQLVEGQW